MTNESTKSPAEVLGAASRNVDLLAEAAAVAAADADYAGDLRGEA